MDPTTLAHMVKWPVVTSGKAYGPEVYVDIYPDPHPEVTTVDGAAARNVPSTPYTTWADIRDGAGTAAAAGSTYNVLNLQAGDIQDKYVGMSRLFFLFDTSVIPAGSRINSAKMCISAFIEDVGLGAPSVAVVPSSPLSNIDLVKADYQNIGTTLYSAAILWTDLTVPHLIDINAAGLATITPQTIVKFGIREATYDIPNVAPTWVSLKKNWLNTPMSEDVNPTHRPFLRVYYQPLL